MMAPALFAALVVTQALADGRRLGVGADTAGVALAGIAAWRGASVIAVVAIAAVTTALLARRSGDAHCGIDREGVGPRALRGWERSTAAVGRVCLAIAASNATARAPQHPRSLQCRTFRRPPAAPAAPARPRPRRPPPARHGATAPPRAPRTRAPGRRARCGSPRPARRRPAADRAPGRAAAPRTGPAPRRDQHAAVRERLELRDAVVLPARRGDEHARAAQQRPVLRGGDHARRTARPLVAAASPATTSVSPVAPRRPPRREHAVEALLLRVRAVGDRGEVALAGRRPTAPPAPAPRAPAPCGAGAAASARSLHGSSSGAAAKRRRSTGRCQIPWRPGRFPAAGESNRIAPGSGHSSAAVLVE